jgi:hypothetical protein
LGVHPLAAQRTQTIQGLVTDATGAVIAGASVKIHNLGTGLVSTVSTNETGNYTFPLLVVGNYDVTCESEGFKSLTARNIRLETGAQVRQDFRLEVGDVTETVEVAASAITLNTENAVVSTTIEQKRIVELPLNGRNIVQLAVLVPGVQFGNRSGLNQGTGGYVSEGSYSVSANGIRELHQVVQMDGTDVADVRRSVTPFVPSIDAIEEFKLQTNSFSAEHGFGGGAVTQITLKSGTNELHGTLWEFLRNDKLDAEAYFLNFERPAGQERQAKNRRRRNQFGFVVSGPIVRNKTFWMFDWEARRERETSIQESYFPNDAQRSGDWSELLTGTINPQTGRLFRNPIVVYDPFTGTPFANNVIPANRLHPGMTGPIYNITPRAGFRNIDPLDFTARRGVTNPLTVNQYYTRIDHHFSDRNRVFGRLAIDRTSFDRFNLNPNIASFVENKATNLATQWVHTFSSNVLNELRFGFQLFRPETLNPRTGDSSFDMDALGIGQFRVAGDNRRELTEDEQGYPNLSLYGINDARTFNNPNNVQFGDHLSIIRGSHNLKMGAEVQHLRMRDVGGNWSRGRIQWSNNEAGLNHAAFQLGVPTSTDSPEGLPLTVPQGTRVGAYFHDDWKFTPKVTVNIGLRVDYSGNPADRLGFWRTLNFPGQNFPEGRAEGNGGYLDPATGLTIPTMGPAFVNDERGDVKLWHQRFYFFMPRVGIAYRPTEKWVVRMGAGWFDNLMHWNGFSVLSLNPPESGSLVFQQAVQSAGTMPVVGADGKSYNVALRRIRADTTAITMDDPFQFNTGGASVVSPVNVLAASPELKDGDVWKWSFDIQRELPLNSALTVGYVGSKSSQIQNSMNNFNSPEPSFDSRVQLNRPWQRFFDTAVPELGVQTLGGVRYLDTGANSFHHGLQVKFDKRYSHGLALGVGYTWSKTHGDGEAGGNEEGGFQLPRTSWQNDRGRLRFDQRQILTAHFVWELGGNNLPGALKHIIGGWQSNGIVSLRSGFPYNLTVAASDLNTGLGTYRPDLVGDPLLNEPSRKLWYNPQAFQRVTCRITERPELCHVGNFGRNVLDSPGQKNLDFGLFKNFQVTERLNLQFRSEFFNALNTPFFGAPTGLSYSSINTITPDGARVGEVRSTRQPMRIIQFGLKLNF